MTQNIIWCYTRLTSIRILAPGNTPSSNLQVSAGINITRTRGENTKTQSIQVYKYNSTLQICTRIIEDTVCMYIYITQLPLRENIGKLNKCYSQNVLKNASVCLKLHSVLNIVLLKLFLSVKKKNPNIT